MPNKPDPEERKAGLYRIFYVQLNPSISLPMVHIAVADSVETAKKALLMIYPRATIFHVSRHNENDKNVSYLSSLIEAEQGEPSLIADPLKTDTIWTRDYALAQKYTMDEVLAYPKLEKPHPLSLVWIYKPKKKGQK